MEGLINAALLLFVVILIFYLIYYMFIRTKALTHLVDAKLQQRILAKTIKTNTSNANSYTYSMWLYVNEWSYRYGKEKFILIRRDKHRNRNPAIALGHLSNTINVGITCFKRNRMENDMIQHNCMVENIPLQKWVNVIVTVYQRTLDIYVDGKLSRSCGLPGVPKIVTGDILVTPWGGFNGWTNNIIYLGSVVNPEEAYNLYKSGLGGVTNGIKNNFKVKVSYLKDNEEQNSITI